MLSVVMRSGIMLSVIIVNVFMLSVVAPLFESDKNYEYKKHNQQI
jgi:hypothetical protein